MPARNEIADQIAQTRMFAQDLIRRDYMRVLHEHTGRDLILYVTAFATRKILNVPGSLMSINLEDVQGFMSALHGLKGSALDLVLHSPGGSLEAVDQIVTYLRSKYDDIRVIVPQNAMSAATMIACAADTIVMGKHSALGPIDPQITFPTESGLFTAPAQSILDEFERARTEVMADPSLSPLWVSKISDYPPGLLTMCQNTIELAIEKVAEWLLAHMYEGDESKSEMAKRIAAWLGDANIHKAHGRPISIDVARDCGLHVQALEDNQEFQDKVMAVFHAAMLSLEMTDTMKFIENHEGKGWFVNVDLGE
jgi:hypothetical protein